MTNKEINIRSIIFLIIGILLVLSLVICIYIVNSQKDLKTVDAIVTNVKEDKVLLVYNQNAIAVYARKENDEFKCERGLW